MNTEVLRRAFRDDAFTAQDANLVLGLRNPYSVLNRLKSAGILERLGRGTYRFTPLEEPRMAPFLEQELIQATRKTRVEDLSRLAQASWEADLASGRIERLGPRRYRLNRRPGVTVRVKRR